MIKSYIKESNDGSITLSIKGHAGAAEEGHDIVCSSVSILAYTLAQYVLDCFENNQLKHKPIIHLEKGEGGVTSTPKDEYYEDIKNRYAFVYTGLNLLSHNYPQYVDKTVW